MPRLLVVDDEPSILHAFSRVFNGTDVRIETAGSAGEALDRYQQQTPDAVVFDVNLPDQTGLDTYLQMRRIDPHVPVVFITGHGTTDTAIQATKLGVLDYPFKPLDLGGIREVVTRAFDVSRRMRVPATLPDEPAVANAQTIIGRCDAMNHVYKLIGRIAPLDAPVLILGESGTGKELVARSLWRHSQRADAPFLAVNCAAIPEALLESELFGHEQGAFTGAERQRIGWFEQCAGGTLFLDEIGDLAPNSQAKLLRVIQEGQFERIGGNEPIHTDTRIIAATNRHLAQLMQSERFRPDLYYRLSVFTIELPPLRDRQSDIHTLAQHFLTTFARSMNKQSQTLDDATLELLEQHDWPGNVRELQSVIKQSLLHAVGPVLLPQFLPDNIRRTTHNNHSTGPQPNIAPGLDPFIEQALADDDNKVHERVIQSVEKHLVQRVLQYTRGNQAKAAKILGITRTTLRNKIRTMKLSPPNRHG